MIVVNVIVKILLTVLLLVAEETLVEFANAVMCSKVSGHVRHVLITMHAFDSWSSAIWIH